MLLWSATTVGEARPVMAAGNPTDSISEDAVAIAAAAHKQLAAASFLGMALQATGKISLQRNGVAVSSGNGDAFQRPRGDDDAHHPFLAVALFLGWIRE